MDRIQRTEGYDMAQAGRALLLDVPSMTCRHCVRAVTAHLRDVEGVHTVEADAVAARVVVWGTMSTADVLLALTACGFPGGVAESSLG